MNGRHFTQVLTGSTPVTSITASKYTEGDTLTLVANAADQKVTNGSNLILESDWISGGAGDQITLLNFDGSNWSEFTRQRPRLRSIIKAADEVLPQSSTTFQDDDHFQFTMLGNAIYYFELTLFLRAVSTTPDFKVQWLDPAGGSHAWQASQNLASVAVGASPSALNTGAITIGLGAQDQAVRFAGRIVAPAGGGTEKLQTAQNTSTAEDVTVLKGSALLYGRAK